MARRKTSFARKRQYMYGALGVAAVAGAAALLWAATSEAASAPKSSLTQAGLEKAEFSASKIKRILAVEGWVEKYAQQRNLDPDLVNGVIMVESGFNPKATSNVGARGLMQIMPATQKGWEKALGVAHKDAFNPQHNIMLGTYGLRSLLNYWDGDIRKALGSYNWGVLRVKESPDAFPSGVENYVAVVQAAQRKFKRAREAS